MDNRFLYIGGQLVDLPEKVKIATTFQAADVTNLTTRFISYTNKFKLPKTANNRLIMGFADMESSETDIPYRELSASYISNGYELISFGTARVMQTDDTFNVTIFFNGYNFFTAIEGKNLDDLITDSMDVYPGAPSPALVQPFLNYGNFVEKSSSIPFTGKEYYSMQYLRLLDLIITNNGYTKSGNIFTHAKLAAMHVSGLGYGDRSDGFTKPKAFLAYRDTSVVFNATSSVLRMNFTDVRENGGFYDNVNTYQVVETNYGGTYFFFESFAKLEIVGLAFAGGATKLKVILHAGYTYTMFITATGIYDLEVSDRVVLDPTGSPVFSSPGLDGAQQFLDIQCVNNVNAPTGTATVTFGSKTKQWNVPSNDKKYYLSSSMLYKSVQALLPKYPQKELIKDFAVRFGILFKEKNQILYCKTIKEIIQDRGSAVDWTSKRVPGSSDVLAYEFQSYAQHNYFDYTQPPESLIDKDMGRGDLQVTNTNLKLTADYYRSDLVKSDTKKLGNETLGYVNAASVPVVEIVKTDKGQEKTEVDFMCNYHVNLANGLVSIPQGNPALGYKGTGPLTVGMRILLLAQNNSTENGIYDVTVATWTRSADSNSGTELDYAFVKVLKGMFTNWYMFLPGVINIGITPQQWVLAQIGTDINIVSSVNPTEDPGVRLTMVRAKYSNEPTLEGGISSYDVAYFDDPDAPAGSASFQAFIDEFYPELQAALRRAKFVSHEYNLTDKDIAELDLFRLVYDGGSYYLLNKIPNYVSGQISKVQLLKV